MLMVAVCALVTLLHPGTAHASGAPMCDEHAQSIEAPPTIWPFRGGTIDRAPNCPETKASEAPGHPDHAAATPALWPREAPLSIYSSVSKRPPDQRLPIVQAAWVGQRPGYTPSVYRPPRA